jgi:hypothetical protein
MILHARHHASITASGCKLTGPVPGSCSTAVAATAGAHSTIALVSEPHLTNMSTSNQALAGSVGAGPHRLDCILSLLQTCSPWFPCLCVHVQDKCSLMQVQTPAEDTGGHISFERCVGHRGMMKLLTTPPLSIKARKCTNCSGCKDCKQPVPLIIPETIGGRGCKAAVEARAEALRQLAVDEANASHSNAGGTEHDNQGNWQPGNAAAGGSNQETRVNTPESAVLASSNPALVECAVCHRKPGDPGVPATLKLCGGCQQVRYCSAECQRKDWKLGHKAMCERISKRNKAS